MLVARAVIPSGIISTNSRVAPSTESGLRPEMEVVADFRGVTPGPRERAPKRRCNALGSQEDRGSLGRP